MDVVGLVDTGKTWNLILRGTLFQPSYGNGIPEEKGLETLERSSGCRLAVPEGKRNHRAPGLNIKGDLASPFFFEGEERGTPKWGKSRRERP